MKEKMLWVCSQVTVSAVLQDPYQSQMKRDEKADAIGV